MRSLSSETSNQEVRCDEPWDVALQSIILGVDIRASL